jgi:hypothetical protein
MKCLRLRLPCSWAPGLTALSLHPGKSAPRWTASHKAVALAPNQGGGWLVNDRSDPTPLSARLESARARSSIWVVEISFPSDEWSAIGT